MRNLKKKASTYTFFEVMRYNRLTKAQKKYRFLSVWVVLIRTFHGLFGSGVYIGVAHTHFTHANPTKLQLCLVKVHLLNSPITLTAVILLVHLKSFIYPTYNNSKFIRSVTMSVLYLLCFLALALAQTTPSARKTTVPMRANIQRQTTQVPMTSFKPVPTRQSYPAPAAVVTEDPVTTEFVAAAMTAGDRASTTQPPTTSTIPTDSSKFIERWNFFLHAFFNLLFFVVFL